MTCQRRVLVPKMLRNVDRTWLARVSGSMSRAGGGCRFLEVVSLGVLVLEVGW